MRISLAAIVAVLTSIILAPSAANAEPDLVTLAGVAAYAPLAASAPISGADKSSKQMITVSASSSSATTAQLTAWQKNSVGQWKAVFGPVAAWVGSGGIGQASEGSTKTPKGTWSLPESFGRKSDPGTALPYFTTDAKDWWDGDINSPTYNTHIRQVSNPGGASENLYYAGEVYDYAAVIGYNLERTPGAGSAFFLHVSGGEPTAGCVAIPSATLVDILQWLKPANKPVIRIGVNVGKPQDDPLKNGDFIRSSSTNKVYRITGGAPVAVTDWAAFGGGMQPTRVLSSTQIQALPQYPADGTFIRVRSSNTVYRIVGGAPLVVTDWSHFGGSKSTTYVDPAAITKAGSNSRFNHLRRYPLGGTAIRAGAGGNVYRIAGTAPIYVSNPNNISSKVVAVTVDPLAITKGGAAGKWNHLRQVPVAGTFIIGWTTQKVYRVSGSGVPVRITSWASFGGVQPHTYVDQVAIDRHGDPGVWRHLR